MNVNDLNILWLDLFEALTYTKKLKLLNISKDVNLRKIFLTNPDVKEILSNEEFNKMALCLQDEYLNRFLNDYKKDNIECITFNDNRYPFLLKEISSPPICLYCKGNLQLLNTNCIAIVGTRKPTEYGIITTKQYAKELADADVTIVSGMASGVDSIAHREVIENNGKTIAVIAGGFNHIYPASNYNLFKQLTENNLVISEYNPNIKPLSYYFPVRNRIIAGLSKGIVITEAGEKSGALHTFNYAIDFNREIFVIPGRINSPMSVGTNAIIKSLQGVVSLSPEDVLTSLNIQKQKNEKNSAVQLDINAQIVIDYIMAEKKSFQQILDFTHLPAKELNAVLIELEMSGLVTKLANNSYIKS